MEMNLMQWMMGKRTSDQQIVDVLAQLLGGFTYETCGAFLNPSCFTLEFPEDTDADAVNVLAEVIMQERAEEYDAVYCPVQEEHTEADHIFVLGLMLYTMLTGQKPDMSMASIFLLNVRDEKKVPLLHVTSSSLNPLVEQMTDLNPRTRCTRQGALDWLASVWKSSAVIAIVEQGTLAELSRSEIQLTEGSVLWKPSPDYVYEEQNFVPVDRKELRISYRVKKIEYTCYVRAEHIPRPEAAAIPVKENILCIGIDFGTWTTTVSYLNAAGCTEDILAGGSEKIPSVMAYKSRTEIVFGNEALALRETHPEAVTNCFKRRLETKTPFVVTAVDGAQIRGTYYDAVVTFLKYLKDLLAEQLDFNNRETSVVLTVPACYDAGQRSALRKAAAEAGFVLQILTEPEAAALFFTVRECSADWMMVLDVGGGTSDLSLLRCEKRSSAEELPVFQKKTVQGLSTLGGIDLTDVLYHNILQNLKLQQNLDMSDQRRSGLNAVQYAENDREIRQLAEQIKCTLSFGNEAGGVLSLNSGNVQKLCVKVRYTRQFYENLLQPSLVSIRSCMEQLLARENLTRQQVRHLIITGGGSLTPAVRRMARDYFSGTSCQVCYVDYSTTVSRGAAVYAGLMTSEENKERIIAETGYDIGVMHADMIHQAPLFECLIPAGSSLQGGFAEGSCELAVNRTDMEGNFVVLRLYRRPRGLGHVMSTLDPGGEHIRYIGKASRQLPEGYDMETDKLEFYIREDEQECLSVSMVHLRRHELNPFQKLQRRLTNQQEPQWDQLGEYDAEFVPAAQTE